MKKFISVLLSVLLLAALFAFPVSAEEKTGSVKILSFNVAGLPSFDYLSDGYSIGDGLDTISNNPTIANQRTIGSWIESMDHDIFATQEDFFYHDYLVEKMTSYNNCTEPQGGVPWGDGTCVMTRNLTMTGEQHIVWESLSGDWSEEDGADEYSRKGITYVCIQLADGVFVDFYDIHADAYGDEGSCEARKDNFRQLADLIATRNTGRPVIITGDFNISASHARYDESAAYLVSRLMEQDGFHDAWIDLYNNGDCYDFSAWSNYNGSYWGHWDSVEKFLYRDGTDISLTCNEFRYINEINGEPLTNYSDHAAIEAVFTYTVADTAENTDKGEAASEKESALQHVLRVIVSFFRSIFIVFANFDAIKAHIFG